MCSKILFLITIVCLASNYSSTQGVRKVFRSDYKYIEAFDSFYKIHMTHKTWPDAEGICSTEGGMLFYPKGISQTLEFIKVLSIFNGTQSSDLLLNEISDVMPVGVYETLDGVPISELYTNWGPFPSENSKYPFVCKRNDVSNSECTLPISGYIYSEEMRRCYKFHLDPKNWTDAYEICNKEQSYLAVINSEAEARFLAKLTQNAPKESVSGDYLSGMVHLGFRYKENKGWLTIHGKKLEDSGYPKWSYNQPDGPSHGAEEFCGSMFYGADLNDIGCQQRGFFICEYEIHTPVL